MQKSSVLTDHEQATILVSNVADTISDDLLFLYIDNITELDGEKGDYSISRHDNYKLQGYNHLCYSTHWRYIQISI